MKTLREVADELCPYRLEDYDPAIDDILDECLHDSWIVGFIAGAQWRENNPVSAGSVSDPESDPIELCGLLWDTENLAIGGYEKDGRHYYTWDEAMEAARSVGKRLPTREEWTALCDLGSTWDDELKGRWFGGNHDSDHKGSLFLPIAGLSSSKGLGYRTKMIGTSTSGYYWSSSPGYGSSNYAVNLYFRSGFVYPLNYFNRANGFSVRCVRDKE
jgi:fibrobacter succinogenes major domain (fib_succ_major)|nr:MAG TPA: Fibrobacter succinogenes major paralogous domain [Caudoviricetes sp.]